MYYVVLHLLIELCVSSCQFFMLLYFIDYVQVFIYVSNTYLNSLTSIVYKWQVDVKVEGESLLSYQHSLP